MVRKEGKGDHASALRSPTEKERGRKTLSVALGARVGAGSQYAIEFSAEREVNC